MRTELRSWRRAWPRVGNATVDVEVEAEVVEEEEEDADEEEEGGGGRRRRRTTLIKSNNPHLAGGEFSGLEQHFWNQTLVYLAFGIFWRKATQTATNSDQVWMIKTGPHPIQWFQNKPTWLRGKLWISPFHRTTSGQIFKSLTTLTIQISGSTGQHFIPEPQMLVILGWCLSSRCWCTSLAPRIQRS